MGHNVHNVLLRFGNEKIRLLFSWSVSGADFEVINTIEDVHLQPLKINILRNV